MAHSKLPDPKDLIAEIRQYQDDTDYLAAFLVDAAIPLGYTVRKNKQPGADHVKRREYVVNVSDFIPMAELIAKSKSTIIPQGLYRLLKRLLKLRQKVNQAHEDAADSQQNKAQNESHKYFNGVVQQTFDILHPLMTCAPQGAPATSVPKDGNTIDTSELKNRFEGLHVEEPSESDASTGADAHSEDEELPKIAPVVLEVSEWLQEQQFFFLIDMFLGWVNEMHRLFGAHWKEYKRGMQSLTTTALLTNTIIDFVRQAERELEHGIVRPKKFPEHEFPVHTFPVLLYIHMNAAFNHLDVDDMKKYTRTTTKHLGFAESEAGYCLYPAFVALNGVILRDNKYSKNMSGEKDLDKEWCTLSKYANMYVVWQSSYVLEFDAHDEVTRGFIHMMKTKQVSVWIMFGMRALYLSLSILNDGLDLHFNQFRSIVERHCSDNSIDAGPFGVHPMQYERLREIFQHKEEYDKTMRKAAFGKNGDGKDTLLEERFPHMAEIFSNFKKKMGTEFPFLMNQPGLCGILAYRAQLDDFLSRSSLEGGIPDMCYLAHVYTAAQTLFPNDPVWPDMEFVLNHQDPERMYFGGKPKDLVEADAKFNLATGVSATFKASNKREQRSTARPKGYEEYVRRENKRHFRSAGDHLTWLFYKRVCPNGDPNSDVHIDAIGTSADTIIPKIMQFMQNPKHYRDLVRRYRMKGWDAEMSLPDNPPPEETLVHLFHHLKESQLDATFNWKLFYRQCMSIWTIILHLLKKDPEWEARYGACDNEYKNSLQAASEMLDQGMTSYKLWGGQSEHPMVAPQLKTAWRVIQGFVQRKMHEDKIDGAPGQTNQYCGDVCLRYQMRHTTCEDPFLLPFGDEHVLSLYKNWTNTALSSSEFFRTVIEDIRKMSKNKNQKYHERAVQALKLLEGRIGMKKMDEEDGEVEGAAEDDSTVRHRTILPTTTSGNLRKIGREIKVQ